MRELWSLFKSHPVVNLVALFILALGLGVGVPMMITSTPHNGLSIVILTLTLVALFLLYDYVVYKKLGRNAIPKRWYRLMVFYIGIACIISGFVIVITQMNFKSEAQTAPTETTTQTTPLETNSTNQTPIFTPSFTFPNFVDTSQIDPNQKINIWLGENGSDFIYKWADFQDTTKTPMTIANLGGMVPFTPHTFGGKIYLDVQVYGNKDSKLITIKDNLGTVIPQNWDRNHDDYSYEVVNQNGDPIFQLSYTTQFTIVLKGIFPFPGGYCILNQYSNTHHLNISNDESDNKTYTSQIPQSLQSSRYVH
jgi:hypothetical protein